VDKLTLKPLYVQEIKICARFAKCTLASCESRFRERALWIAKPASGEPGHRRSGVGGVNGLSDGLNSLCFFRDQTWSGIAVFCERIARASPLAEPADHAASAKAYPEKQPGSFANATFRRLSNL
jgi:hypothetical protein